MSCRRNPMVRSPLLNSARLWLALLASIVWGCRDSSGETPTGFSVVLSELVLPWADGIGPESAAVSWRNDTGLPVHVVEVTSNCPCVRATLSSTLIEPGGQGEIRVSSTASPADGGDSHYTVFVVADRGMLELPITVMGPRSVKFVPRYLTLECLAGEDMATGRVHLSFPADRVASPEDVEFGPLGSPVGIRILDPKADSGQYECLVTARPPAHLGSGQFDCWASATDEVTGEVRRASLTVMIRRRDRLSVSPTLLLIDGQQGSLCVKATASELSEAQIDVIPEGAARAELDAVNGRIRVILSDDASQECELVIYTDTRYVRVPIIVL